MIKLVKLLLPVEEKRFKKRDAEKLRGFFGNFFQNYTLFHHHINNNQIEHTYSYIQYKIIDGNCSIIGLQEGAELLLKLSSSISHFILEEERYETSPKIILTFPKLSVSLDKKFLYRFETPWFALNQQNYLKYRNGTFDLNKQLSNNILELFKMLQIQATERISVQANLEECILQHKNNNIVAFVGEFITNVDMPDYISLGKRKSIGLGTIRKIREIQKG